MIISASRRTKLRKPLRVRMPRVLPVAALALISRLFTGCGVHDDQSGSTAQTKSGTPEILWFNGAGSSPNDVKAFETFLKGLDFPFSTGHRWSLVLDA